MKGGEIIRFRAALCAVVACCIGIGLLPLKVVAFQRLQSGDPVRATLILNEQEREYFVHLPAEFRPGQVYWALVAVHGGGGTGSSFGMAAEMRRWAEELGLAAIVVAPSFSNDDFLASRFPALGEGEFLDRVLDELRGEYRLRPKILLTGYSRGGQFSHRFALQNPEKVEACAPFAAGTWTTPDGRFLIDRFGEVSEPESFLSTPQNATDVPERLRDLFQPRVAAVAGLAADPASKAIPFLVMNGTLDPRLPIAREFARSLGENGYSVETDWPRTPHVCGDDPACRVEFGRYAQRAVEFFLSVAGS